MYMYSTTTHCHLSSCAPVIACCSAGKSTSVRYLLTINPIYSSPRPPCISQAPPSIAHFTQETALPPPYPDPVNHQITIDTSAVHG